MVVNLLVFGVLAELAGLTIYYYRTGHLFYTHERVRPRVAEARGNRLTGDGLHPYFGPTHQPGHPFDLPVELAPAGSLSPEPNARTVRLEGVETNNFGFASRVDYPYEPAAGELVIGIFGGSVGVWFCHVGAPRMIERLQAHPAFRGHVLVPLCFSHEGYKQPQQLQVLSYFLALRQRFDLVINIDGFNEVALGALNDARGIDSSMPSVMHLDPLLNLVDQATLTEEKVVSLAAITRERARANALTERLGATRLAGVHFVLEQLRAMAMGRYQAEVTRFAELPSIRSEQSLILVTPSRSRSDVTVYEDIAATWVGASALMRQLLTARGAGYLHVLQPNQYHTARVFGPDEARIARNDGSPFKPGVEQGYPALLQAAVAGTLREQRVRFVNGVGIFDKEPAAVYMDDCCHYTRRGNEILADVIADAILAAPETWGAAPTSR